MFKQIYGILIFAIVITVFFTFPSGAESEGVQEYTVNLYEITEEESETEYAEEVKVYDIPIAEEEQKQIMEICREYGMDETLIFAMIGVESEYTEKAVGDSGASEGYMQIQRKWHSETMKEEGVNDLLDGMQNVRAGCAILRKMLIQTDGDIRMALSIYNTGKKNCTKGKRYAEKVLRRKEKLETWKE